MLVEQDRVLDLAERLGELPLALQQSRRPNVRSDRTRTVSPRDRGVGPAAH